MTETKPPPLVILDDRFPYLRDTGGFSGRKHADYTGLMHRIDGSLAWCPNSRDYSRAQHARSVAQLVQQEPRLATDRFCFGSKRPDLNGGLAYVVFPNKALKHLPSIEAAGLRFVVTLYPGGGLFLWGEREEVSLRRLHKLASHPAFRGFIVHHTIIQDYLAQKIPQAPVFAFEGGFTQIRPEAVQPKTYFGRDRRKLNICFVANRYDPLGLGKGFDVFLETARQACKVYENIEFHAVGNWPQDASAGVREDDPVTFHGYITADALPGFFKDMDLIVSPTRVDVPGEGKFDGFPLVIDAAFCGVGMCVTDPVKQNRSFRPDDDLWIIEPDAGSVMTVIAKIMDRPVELVRVSQNGSDIVHRLRNYDEKMDAKADVLSKLLV